MNGKKLGSITFAALEFCGLWRFASLFAPCPVIPKLPSGTLSPYNSLSLSTIGDSFVQINQFDDALSFYEKALNASSNSFTSPIILLKAGDVSLKIGNKKKALKFFNSIKTDYPKSSEADLIDIKIEQAK